MFLTIKLFQAIQFSQQSEMTPSIPIYYYKQFN